MPSTTPSKPSPLLLAISVFVVHTLLRAVIVFGPGMGGPAAADETRFHMPVIQSFAEQWPSVDLSSYAAASTPGHHLALALLERGASSSVELVRFVSGAPISVLLAMLVWWCARRVGAIAALALALPLACSPHAVGFATLVVPESTSWLLVAVVLLVTASRRVGIMTCVTLGVLLFASAGVRQLTLWCAAPIWVAAWLSGSSLVTHPSRVLPECVTRIDAPRERLVRAGIAFVCTLPAFALVGWFMNMWGGLVPPGFQSAEAAAQISGGVVNQGLSLSAPAFTLCLVGVAGFFFLPMAASGLRSRSSTVIRWGVGGAVVALVLSLAVPTSYSMEDGRWGGLWNAARLLPTILDRSLFTAGGAMVGGAVVGGLVIGTLPVRARWVLLSALVASMAAHSAGAQVFQRYIEPLVLILLPIAIGCAYEQREDRPPVWSLLGPAALAALLTALTISRVGAAVPA